MVEQLGLAMMYHQLCQYISVNLRDRNFFLLGPCARLMNYPLRLIPTSAKVALVPMKCSASRKQGQVRVLLYHPSTEEPPYTAYLKSYFFTNTFSDATEINSVAGVAFAGSLQHFGAHQSVAPTTATFIF